MKRGFAGNPPSITALISMMRPRGESASFRVLR